MAAAALGLATICSAWVYVVARALGSREAHAALALVATAAGVAVVARLAVGGKHAACLGIAGVGRAGVAVTAGFGLAGHAAAALALVALCAGAAVAAWREVGGVGAGAGRAAPICCARVIVRAEGRNAGCFRRVLGRISAVSDIANSAVAIERGADSSVR
jgi:hypothetical protein